MTAAGSSPSKGLTINTERVYLAGISIGGLVLLGWSILNLAASEDRGGLLLLAILAALATIAPTWYRFGKSEMVYEVGSAVVLAAVPHYGVEGAIFVVVFSTTSFWVYTSVTKGAAGKLHLLLFNLGMHAIAITLAAGFFHLLSPMATMPVFFGLVWIGMAIVYDQANVWLVLVVFYLREAVEQRSFIQLWQGNRWAMLLNIMVSTLGGGVLTFALARYGTSSLLIFFLPIFLSALAFQLYTGKMKAHLVEMETLIAERTQALEVSNVELRVAIEQLSFADQAKERVNEQLKNANQQLRDIAQAKDRFLAVLSHDMRSPITSISLYGQMLQKRPSLPPEKRKRMYDVILQNAHVLVDLVDDVVEVERLAGKTTVPNYSQVDIAELGMQIMNSFAAQAAQKRIGLRLDSAEPSLHIDADIQLIRRTLTNLVSNAIKYTPKDGAVSLSIEQALSHVQVTVADTGFGIPEEDLPHIFDSYHRVKEHQRHAKGLGLGLSIVKHYVEAHNGTISVESEVGVGSRFKITLPISNQTQQEISVAIEPLAVSV